MLFRSGVVTVSKYGFNAITLQPQLRPDGTVDLHPIRSEGFAEMLVGELSSSLKHALDGLKQSAGAAVQPLEDAINSRLRDAHLRVRTVTIEDGKLTLVAEPAPAVPGGSGTGAQRP